VDESPDVVAAWFSPIDIETVKPLTAGDVYLIPEASLASPSLYAPRDAVEETVFTPAGIPSIVSTALE
jgi:hypothetical protein